MHSSLIDALVYATAMLQSNRNVAKHLQCCKANAMLQSTCNVAKHLPVQEQLVKIRETAA
jgi:hypothetical protein